MSEYNLLLWFSGPSPSVGKLPFLHISSHVLWSCMSLELRSVIYGALSLAALGAVGSGSGGSIGLAV